MLLGWLTLLGVVAAIAFTIQKGFDENFSLPGPESQEALDSLNRTFPQVSGTTAQVVVVTPEGGSVRGAAVRDAIEVSVQRLEQIDLVDRVTSPFDKYKRCDLRRRSGSDYLSWVERRSARHSGEHLRCPRR